MAKKKKKMLISRSPEDTARILGLDSTVALEWELRHKIISQIASNIERKGLLIADLAKKAKTTQARISNLKNGSSSGMSLDFLVRVLACTGQKVEIRFLRAS